MNNNTNFYKMLTKKEQNFLLNLARDSIKERHNPSSLKLSEIPDSLKEKRGVFVTLHKNGNLRGCIGTLTATSPIYKAVIDNSINAAFHDPRFLPVSDKEVKDLEIEISILTEPTKLDYTDSNDLLNKLNKEFGVILKKGYRTATFLPQVWGQIEDKQEFLSHLCMKAGLSHDEWKEKDAEIYVYKVEKFGE